jgi:pyruvate dehydrogenase E2 component (dihydrolipoamide acetyltransferase)
MEIPSSHAGGGEECLVKVGDKVRKARRVAARRAARLLACYPRRRRLRARRRTRPPVSASRLGGPRTVPAADAHGGVPHSRAAAARVALGAPFARELGVPLAEVKGSGPKGRITQDDVQGFVKGVMAGEQDRGAEGARRRPRPAAGRRSPACCPGRRSTSPSSAPSSARTCRASRRSAAPTCIATG